ncbi:hypothetical protein FJY84_00910 [Candidatus Bathyarchaeota archaeon]|nr:hypothetical protein [Candidatus Bathyarchaeota archaeon]
MGKFYTIIGYDLYIYVTGREDLIDLEKISNITGFFESNNVWRLSPKLIFGKDVSRSFLNQVLRMLNIEGYQVRDNNRGSLEHFFASGDERNLK